MALLNRITKARNITAVHGLLNRCLSAEVAKCYSTNTQTAEKSNSDITELKGRPWLIFASPVDTSLVCAVSADLEMHRGIAKEFKKTFENIEELKQQNKKVGEVAVAKRNDSSFIYHLLVRNKWWDQGTKEAFESSLSAMKDHCLENNVTELALPRLGTGDDGVDWEDVKAIIAQVFNGTGINIKAYCSR